MELAKPRKWTEQENKLVNELAQRKERVPTMARGIGFTSPLSDDELVK
jgi:hypothetical protein